MAERWIITAAYGRCIEGAREAREALERALIACKYSGRHPDQDPEVAACARDLDDWARLARETSCFLEQVA